MVCFSAPKTGSVNIIERFGKFSSVRRAGLSVLIPCLGEYKAGTVSLRLQALTVRCETKTKDNVFVNVEVVVQYLVTDAEKYYYKLSDPQSQMKSFIFDVIRSLVPNLRLDEVFVSKNELADAVGKSHPVPLFAPLSLQTAWHCPVFLCVCAFGGRWRLRQC